MVDATISAGEPEDLITPNSLVASAVPMDAWYNNQRVGHACIPALALPLVNKAAFVWPEEQDRFFREELLNGCFKRVLLVGWRAAEGHFTALLPRLVPPTAKMLIVTGGGSSELARQEGTEVVTNFGTPIGRAEIRFSVGGFVGLLAEDMDWLLA
jgi:hypothetical protein